MWVACRYYSGGRDLIASGPTFEDCERTAREFCGLRPGEALESRGVVIEHRPR